MRVIILITIVFIQISCAVQKPLKFTTYKTAYLLYLPKGYKLKRLKDDEGYREYQALYPDSSIIYITDDVKAGGISKAKEEEYGVDIYVKMLANENLVLRGSHNNGNYWKVEKRGKIIIGYVNVIPSKKEEYDKIIDTLKTKKEKKSN